MAENTLQTFIEKTTAIWGPLDSGLVAGCRAHVQELLGAPDDEPWLAALHRDLPDYRELYRDPTHDFLLLAHAEAEGRYRLPHDHGRGWVIYAVQQGEMEMGTFVPIEEPGREERLVKRETYRVRAGDVRVFLPGDVHDTRCVGGPLLYYRFTDRDLRKERRMKRYETACP
jgi:hypothetical protein